MKKTKSNKNKTISKNNKKLNNKELPKTQIIINFNSIILKPIFFIYTFILNLFH
jgi:hypothetical protein